MTPYWQSRDGAIAVYHARFEDVLAAGCVPVRDVALVHDDPPYGVNVKTRRLASYPGSNKRVPTGLRPTHTPVASRDFPEIKGDKEPFDPSPILLLDRPTVLWGANHYASRVPDASGWILWDKRDGTTPDDGSDGELAWTNFGGPLRIFRHLWRGLVRGSETQGKHLGPTQKPIALSTYAYQRAELRPGDLVFVPHGGSGPDLPACRAAGLRLIWCDVEQWCCDTAIARLPDAPIEIVARAKEWQRRAITAERAAEPVGPLFATVPR